MSGFTKLLSPKDKVWIVALLLGALQIMSKINLSRCSGPPQRKASS